MDISYQDSNQLSGFSVKARTEAMGPGLTHEASGVGDVSADLAVDLDKSLHADFLNLISSQSVLQPIPQEDDEGQALPQLVGTSGRPRSLGTGKRTSEARPPSDNSQLKADV